MTLKETIIKLKNTRDYENLEEILGSELGNLLYQVVNKSKSEEDMKIYATEAIKADRERVAKAANVRTVATPLGDYYEVDKESILNLPIELP